jgi:hypothetical protein
VLCEFADASYAELSQRTGRSIRAVKHKVLQLGIVRAERRRWSDAEYAVLRASGGRSVDDVARELGRSPVDTV